MFRKSKNIPENCNKQPVSSAPKNWSARADPAAYAARIYQEDPATQQAISLRNYITQIKNENIAYMKSRKREDGRAIAYIGTNLAGAGNLKRMIGTPAAQHNRLRNAWDGAAIDNAIRDAYKPADQMEHDTDAYDTSDLLILKILLPAEGLYPSQSGMLRWEAIVGDAEILGSYPDGAFRKLREQIELESSAERSLGGIAMQSGGQY